MIRMQVAHTADLSAAELRAVRALLDEVFDDMTDDDWEHTLGGMHVLAREGDMLIGHAALVQRRLLYGGTALRTGYVEGVAVRVAWRRGGCGGAMMSDLERLIRGAYDLGALCASDEGRRFYLGRGWQVWRGPTAAMTPSGIVRTPEEDGAVMVFSGAMPLDLDAELVCDWRDGDVW